MFTKTFFAGTAFGVLCGGLAAGALALNACVPTQQDTKTAHDSVILANDACVVIEDTAPDGSIADKVCATEAELVPYINLILGGRRHVMANPKAGDATVDAH